MMVVFVRQVLSWAFRRAPPLYIYLHANRVPMLTPSPPPRAASIFC